MQICRATPFLLCGFGSFCKDPTLGKWLTQDPLGLKADPNLYAYVLNNPMTLLDEYGLIEDQNFPGSNEFQFDQSTQSDSSSTGDSGWSIEDAISVPIGFPIFSDNSHDLSASWTPEFNSIQNGTYDFHSQDSYGHDQGPSTTQQYIEYGLMVLDVVDIISIGCMLLPGINIFGTCAKVTVTAAKAGIRCVRNQVMKTVARRVIVKECRLKSAVSLKSIGKNILSSPPSGKGVVNANPFKGPVSKDIMVSDAKGNIIPVNRSQQLTGSSDGKWIQVRDKYGSPTGLRKDGAHSKYTHNDPRALKPHSHDPNITNSDGTPWLSIHE